METRFHGKGVLVSGASSGLGAARARAALGHAAVRATVAGVWPSEDIPVWWLPLEGRRATPDQNLTATLLTARGFLREVERNGRAPLVLVGSTAGRFGEAGHADGAAARSALQGGLPLSLENGNNAHPCALRKGLSPEVEPE